MTTVEYSKAKTCVWWDIENCEVPRGWDAHGIAQNVGSALLNMNYSGPVSILAYGDTNLIPHHVQQALSSTGVGLNHVPAGVKDASDKKILVDMLLWAVDNPAPANIMLISGDRDFSNALHQLSMRRYTILLAQPPHASAPLVAAAKNVWLWTSLASGGPPLTSSESSQLVNNGRCNVSNPVSELAGDSKDHKTRDNHVPRGATGESVTSSDSFRAHLSDKRHTSQAAFVASHKAYVSVSAKPIQEADVVEPVLCTVCQISCTSEEEYARHTYSKRHQNNLELQSGKAENVSRGAVPVPKEVLARQKNKTKARGGRTRPNSGYACRLCNVAYQSQVVYDSHLKGQKHAAMLSKLDEALIDFNKLQKKSVGEKSEARETITESQLQFQNTQEETKYLEKRSEELREILLGTSKSNVKEEFLRTKDQPEIVTKQFPNGEAKECFDGIVKLVNESQGATYHSGEMKKKQEEVMERREITPRHKLCHLCVVICDIQGVSTLVCNRKKHWLDQKHTKAAFVPSDDSVWCQVCQIRCISKAAYENHTYGKKHRHKLELQSAKNDNKSKEQAKLSEDNAEKSKDQTAFYSQNHAAMVKDQTESLNTQEKTKYLEKRSEELREIPLGTSKSSVDEKFLRTKDQPEIVTKQGPNGEAKECFDGIVKPVNESQGATYHSGEVKKKQEEVMELREIKHRHKLCHLCVVICDSQGVSTLVCDSKSHWLNQKHTKAAFVASDDDVWCQVCKIRCISKTGYENHTNGKKHRHKLELQSAKNENMSKEQAKLSENNAEKGKDQTAIDSLNHAALVKDQTENAKLREALEQEDQEEVKEVNTISENLVHVFNGLNRESRVFKESRGCLDVIPERVLVSPDVNVTGKFEDDSKHKQEREKEAAEREESKKVQVDNLWTHLWWGKS